MKLIAYNPACHEDGWPLATVTITVTKRSESEITTTMIIALPQWLVEEGEAHPDYLDDDGAFVNNTHTADLFTGWQEEDDCKIEVLCIRPIA
jgi:hypothetical protein